MRKHWMVIIISISLIMFGIGLFFGYRPLTSITAEDLCDDYDVLDGTFDSYGDGDTILIYDEIQEIEYFSTHMTTGEPIDWTYITFKSVDMSIDEIGMLMYNPSKIWGFMIFKGDLRASFESGDNVKVQVRVSTLEFGGTTLEILDWYEDMEDAAINADDLEDISFNDLDVGDQDDISHASFIPEISFFTMALIGTIFLILGAIKLKHKKEVKFKLKRDIIPPESTHTTSYHNGIRQSPSYRRSDYQRSRTSHQLQFDVIYDKGEQDGFNSRDRYWRSETGRSSSSVSEGHKDDVIWEEDLPPKTFDTHYRDRAIKERFRCPECGNIMEMVVPYRPFECYCDNCGVMGEIE